VDDSNTKNSPRELFQSLLGRTGDEPSRDQPRRFYIDFGNRDGNRYALKYTDIKWIKLVGATIIDIHFATHHVEIVGTRLGMLYEQLLREEVHKLDPLDERLHHAGPRGVQPQDGKAALPVVLQIVVLQKPDGIETTTGEAADRP
jgi:hypothetical protein